MSFVAIRRYSPNNRHGQKKELWKVLSRPMDNKDYCEDWLRFEKTQQKHPENYDWFIVQTYD